ncbi:MAG: hypothetical protein RIB59_04225 [Rhodospirillales bacterium]
MKNIFLSVIFFVFVLALPVAAAAESPPVDLRGKKGIVDPRDLKKSDPKERGLRIKEPPPPERRERPKTDTPPKSPPTDEGNGPRRKQLPVPIDPRRGGGPIRIPGR